MCGFGYNTWLGLAPIPQENTKEEDKETKIPR